MSLTTMYPAKNNSPATILTAELSSGGNTMTVEDPSVFPAAPNLAVLGSSNDAEIVLYTAISGNSMTIVRGQNGTTPGTWGIGTSAARNFTSQDHEAFRENILDLENRKANTTDLGDLATLDAVSWGEVAGMLSNQTDLKNALDAKQDELTFDSAPTSGSSNPVTSDGINSALSSKANTADLGEMAAMNDAPSDDSGYVRKNGDWAVASSGSGLPAGGTIGQILAKRSDTDGDAGWFSIRDLPRRKWYLVDGITETDVIAAYQFVYQPNEATALLNINDGTDYPLSKVLGSENWSVNRGFFIPGSQNAGLTNGTLAGLYTNMLSAAFGFYGASTSKSCAPGIMPNRQRVLELASYTSEYTGKPTISTYSNTNAYLGSTFSSKGVLSGNWEATPKMYRDGVALSLLKSGTIFSSGRGKIFGHLNDVGTYSSCYITALVFYNVALNASQHVELANNIYELGGLD